MIYLKPSSCSSHSSSLLENGNSILPVVQIKNPWNIAWIYNLASNLSAHSLGSTLKEIQNLAISHHFYYYYQVLSHYGLSLSYCSSPQLVCWHLFCSFSHSQDESWSDIIKTEIRSNPLPILSFLIAKPTFLTIAMKPYLIWYPLSLWPYLLLLLLLSLRFILLRAPATLVHLTGTMQPYVNFRSFSFPIPPAWKAFSLDTTLFPHHFLLCTLIKCVFLCEVCHDLPT